MQSLFRRFSTTSLLIVIFVGVASAANSVTLLRTFGTVEVQKAGKTAWSPANERLRLRAGDRLRTGANGSALAELTEGNVIRLTENSLIVLETVTTENARVAGRALFGNRSVGNYVVRLERGHAMPVLQRFGGSTMTLSTPVATTGVRGTVYEAIVEEAGGVSGTGSERGGNYNVDIIVHEGSVDVTDRSSGATPVTVFAGQSMSFRNVRVPPGGFNSSAPGRAPNGPGNPGPGEREAGSREAGVGPQAPGNPQGPGNTQGPGSLQGPPGGRPEGSVTGIPGGNQTAPISGNREMSGQPATGLATVRGQSIAATLSLQPVGARPVNGPPGPGMRPQGNMGPATGMRPGMFTQGFNRPGMRPGQPPPPPPPVQCPPGEYCPPH